MIIMSVIVSIVFIITATIRILTTLENVLFQIIILVIALYGSYLTGKQSANDSLKLHARSAFRRVLLLYSGLSRLNERIVIDQDKAINQIKPSNVDIYEAIINEQIYAANDAMEDWRDLVPEEVEAVEKLITNGRRQL